MNWLVVEVVSKRIANSGWGKRGRVSFVEINVPQVGRSDYVPWHALNTSRLSSFLLNSLFFLLMG